jgi:hypothetical protein
MARGDKTMEASNGESRGASASISYISEYAEVNSYISEYAEVKYKSDKEIATPGREGAKER